MSFTTPSPTSFSHFQEYKHLVETSNSEGNQKARSLDMKGFMIPFVQTPLYTWFIHNSRTSSDEMQNWFQTAALSQAAPNLNTHNLCLPGFVSHYADFSNLSCSPTSPASSEASNRVDTHMSFFNPCSSNFLTEASAPSWASTTKPPTEDASPPSTIYFLSLPGALPSSSTGHQVGWCLQNVPGPSVHTVVHKHLGHRPPLPTERCRTHLGFFRVDTFPPRPVSLVFG